MNKKGQALVEFVLILPVFILLIFIFSDIVRIALAKNYLENSLDDVVILYRNNEEDKINNFLNNDSYNITYSKVVGEEYVTIKLETKVKMVTPGMKRIISNPYKVVVERRIIYEQ